jgi:peptidoglycan hydrolase CwlO-like protein
MRHNLIRQIIAVAVVFCLLTAGAMCDAGNVAAYAKTTQENIDDALSEIDRLQNEKKDAQSNVNDISNKKDSLESNLSGLNTQLGSLVESINDLEEQISDKDDEIAAAEEELEAAQEKASDQYEDMKVRIKFMYENSNISLWQMFLESSSISEFLNRTEYISDINKYDRQMLDEYQTLAEDIAAQKEALEGEKEELVAMQDDYQSKQNSVNSLISQTKANISQADDELSDAKDTVSEIETQIAKMEAYELELEAQKAKEDAARLAAILAQEQEDTSGVVYVPTDSDVYLLGAIIQCESDGEPYEGKLAVGSVVMNRVKSSYFPNTVSGVIYQSGQFSPVASGRYAYRLSAGVNSTCLKAAEEVLGGNITLNALFFRRVNMGITQGTVIGNHIFY